MPIIFKVTSAGRAALINAENNGTAPVTITEIGLSETAIEADPGDVVLTDEFKRVATISGEVVSPDTIHVTMFDDGGDAYSMRSFALYLDDGTLFGLYGQVDPILEKTAASIASLAVDIVFVDVDAESVTFGDATFSNPPASETRQGVAEIATQAESNTGTDDQRILTPKKAKGSILAWLLGLDGAGSGIDADLLDGQQGSWYADIAARLGFTPARALPGQIGMFAMNTAPTGYLACDGAAVSRTTYAALFAAIGTTYGTGNGSTTFNLPDARGEFLRGWDNGRGVDPGRQFGSAQTDAFRAHYHEMTDNGNGDGDTAGRFDIGSNQNAGSGLKVSTSTVGGTETRPRNLAILICIKT